MKIAHLTSVHSATDVRIFHKEARSLANAGYEVTIIAASGSGRVCDGVRIRIVSSRRHRLERMLGTVREVLKAAIEEDAAVYHFHDPELIPAGLWLKWRGKRVVYDVHEDLPRQLLTKSWIPRGCRRVVGALAECGERFGAAFFDGIVGATPDIAERFPPAKTVVVHNFPILPEWEADDELLHARRPQAVAYIGSLSRERGIREMVAALEKTSKLRNVRLLLAGKWESDTVRNEVVVRPGWHQVDFMGWQGRAGIKHILKQARAGIVVLQPTKNYMVSYPVKMFEYMAAGLPVIASDFSRWRDVVGRFGCGILVDPCKPEAIAKAIEWIINNPHESQEMGKRGRTAIDKMFNWEREEKNLLKFYKRITS